MKFAYYRVSTIDQSVAAQRQAMGGAFDREFTDEGVSGGVMAAQRPGFANMLNVVRSGDTIYVYGVDRLGRDALDVQSTVRALLDLGVTVHVHGLGPIGRGVGELILAVLAQVGEMERRRIAERTAAGRAAARASMARTGKTQHGKETLGRPHATDAVAVRQWRDRNQASIQQTAAHFNISTATVKRYCSRVQKSDHCNGLQHN